jgi:hypothetical protein
MPPPKILLYDVETSPIVTATFSLYPDSINHENIIQDWFMISAAWKELGKKTIYSSAISDVPEMFDMVNDFEVVKSLRDAMQDADILIGHNSIRFDTKRLNARLIYHGLDPLPSGIQQVDTLKEVKKVAAFTSNKLDYLGATLLGEGKMETSKGLWMRVIKGDTDAVKEMVIYNKKDVQLLEDVYLKLRPYMKGHPHIGVLHGEDRQYSCPKCGSTNLIQIKNRYSAAGVKKIQKQCADCHGYTTFNYKVENQ